MCDRYFINEPGEWFRTEDGNEMVNNKTSFFECGTQYSIYMQGMRWLIVLCFFLQFLLLKIYTFSVIFFEGVG